jgi:Glycosyltransferase like family 2
MQAWHSLRFAQRHQVMSSMALSRRLLVVTGRMSIYRAAVAIDPGFIDLLENDHLDHWRFGRFPLLTGEDKSTWYWLLRRGRRMLYLPDVRVVTVEHPPAKRLLPATTKLMLRWSSSRCPVAWSRWWCGLTDRSSSAISVSWSRCGSCNSGPRRACARPRSRAGPREDPPLASAPLHDP